VLFQRRLIPVVGWLLWELMHEELFTCREDDKGSTVELLDYVRHLQAINRTPLNVAGLRDYQERRAKQLGDPSFAEPLAEYSTSDLEQLQSRFLNEWIVSALIAGMPSDAANALKKIPVIVLPLRAVNAHTFRAPTGEPIIVVDQGFINMADYYLDMLHGARNLDERGQTSEARAYIVRSLKFIVRYFVEGGAPDYPLELVEMTMSERALVMGLTWGILAFCVAHEFAHVYLGHLERTAPRHVGSSQDASEVDVYQMLQEQELQADEQGCRWYLSLWRSIPVVKSLPPAIGAVAPLSLFPLLALIEANTEEPDKYSSHPAALRRVIELIQKLYLTAEEDTEEFALKAMEQTYLNYTQGKDWCAR
jgi:hypothetical protein